jgi:AcrR family transcriptional regulator
MSSEARRPGLTRRAIAEAALELVDAEGAERLTVRSLASRLDAGAMSLYRHVPSREAIVGDVVGLLLDEIEVPDEADLTWEEGARRVGRSLRAMALRHPRAFALVAVAPSDRPPLVGFAAALRDFYAGHGVPADAFESVWSILDAFETGFLLLETQALLAGPALDDPRAGDQPDAETRDLARRMPRTLEEAAYEEGMDIIISGLARRLDAGAGG